MNVMTDKKILVIVPACNESGNIRTTISELRSLPRPLDIIVIDDGSVDKTAALAREAGAAVISLPFNLGIGGAVQTGFLFARKKDYAFVVQVDGDGQHDVRYLDAILKPVMDDCVDIAVGSRFPPFLNYQSSRPADRDSFLPSHQF